jgi:uncharacterized membrane protein
VEIRTLFGLPAHPLLVHVPIVLLPLVGIGAIAIAVSARARERFGLLTLVLAGMAFLGTLLAAGSGETLVDSVQSSAALREHVDLAGTMRPLALLLLVAVGAVVFLDRRHRSGTPAPRGASLAAAVLAIALAVGTNGWLVAVGHNGAEATWQNVHLDGGGGDQGPSTTSGG